MRYLEKKEGLKYRRSKRPTLEQSEPISKWLTELANRPQGHALAIEYKDLSQYRRDGHINEKSIKAYIRQLVGKLVELERVPVGFKVYVRHVEGDKLFFVKKKRNSGKP